MTSIPLHQVVKERIRADFLLCPLEETPQRLPSERELQSRYQVSRPTVTRALAALVAEGLLENRPQSGYYRLPLLPAEAETEREVPLLGYVAPLAGEELVQRTFRGIDRLAQRRGYRVLMCSAGNDVSRERAAVSDLIASGASGIIITPFPRTSEVERDQDYLRQETYPVPIVLCDTGMPEQGKPCVLFDNARATHNAVSWLYQNSRRRIALLSFVESILHRPLADRYQGYCDALADLGLPFDPALVRRYDSRDDIPAVIGRILEEWLALVNPPDAIISVDDLSALEVIDQLQRRGVNVPEQVMVMGFDNRMIGRRFHPAFPTTNPDFQRLGEVACDLLIQQIASGSREIQTIFLDLPLLIRQDSRLLHLHPDREPIIAPVTG
jgi:DNA-binding LacI/PurR family transcriptional regulator